VGGGPEECNEFRRRKVYSSAYSASTANRLPALTRSQSSRGDQGQVAASILKRSGTAEAEKEGDMTAACDLADDLRDAIVEYQVSTWY
jgi:hypothetical protein